MNMDTSCDKDCYMLHAMFVLLHAMFVLEFCMFLLHFSSKAK